MTTLDVRCPQCAALVRPGLGWCTLCHADLRPPPAPLPDPEPPTATEALPEALTAAGRVGDPVLVDPVLGELRLSDLTDLSAPDDASSLAEAAGEAAAAAAASGGRAGGKHARRAPAAPSSAPPTSAAAAPGLPPGADDYGDLLADPEVAFAILRAEGRDPFLAKVEDRLSSPGARAAVIVGGGLALTVALFVGFTLLGLILR